MTEHWRAVPDDDRPDMFWNVVDERRHCIATGMTAEDARLIAAARELRGALQFILAFYEPGQRHLDTEAWKVAMASAQHALAKSRPDVAGGSK